MIRFLLACSSYCSHPQTCQAAQGQQYPTRCVLPAGTSAGTLLDPDHRSGGSAADIAIDTPLLKESCQCAKGQAEQDLAHGCELNDIGLLDGHSTTQDLSTLILPALLLQLCAS